MHSLCRTALMLLSVLLLTSCNKPPVPPPPADPAPRCDHPAWSAGILRGSDVFSLDTPAVIKNPVLVAADVTDRHARFIADTFLFPHHNKWFMFFEVMNRSTEQGDIGYAESKDGLHWTYKGIVLDEPFHLSYPYVFEADGAQYMIPETRHANAIRLYKADPFPAHWKFVKTLVPGSYADSSIVHYKDRWWIFTERETYTLAIFSASTLMGPWKEVPMSPIYTHDKTKSRAGGRVTPYKGKLLRFAQDSTGGYGHQLRVFIIDELTPTTYKEHEAAKSPILIPSGNGWKSSAMHTLDPWQTADGSWIASIDGAGCNTNPD